MKIENQIQSIEVHEITLLYLCKTATKKTLHLAEPPSKDYKWIIILDCEIDEDNAQRFFVQCESEPDARELERQCVEWLNY